jgi:hypothetical protein
MRMTQHAPYLCARGFAVRLCAVSLIVVGGCNMPQDVSPPAIRPPPIDASLAPTDGLIGEWKMDETSGATAHDSKNNYDAPLNGQASFGGGHLGNALVLNNDQSGTGDDFATMPTNGDLDNVQEGSYTLSAWFYPDTVPLDQSLTNRYYAIVAKAGQPMGIVYSNLQKFSMRHYLTKDVLKIAQGSTAFPAQHWYHVAGVVAKAGGMVKLFVNGQLQDTIPFTSGTSAWEYGTTRFQVGKAGTQWAANGKVDQVRIYNRALSGMEVDSLYQESAAAPIATGIPYGLFGIASTNTDTRWTGSGLQNKVMSSVLSNLRNAQSRNPPLKIWFNLTYADEAMFFVSANDHRFKFKAWRDTLDAHVAIPALGDFKANGASFYNDSIRNGDFYADGTMQGHSMLDDLNKFQDSTGRLLITQAQIDSMAAHSKLRFPDMLTAVRYRPTQLQSIAPACNTCPGGHRAYQTLDVGWAQFRWDQEPASTWRDAEVLAAQQLNLGLVMGINITNGPGTGMVPTSDVSSWGTTFLQSDYICGFIMWDQNYGSLGNSIFGTLGNLAKNHVAAPCKRR